MTRLRRKVRRQDKSSSPQRRVYDVRERAAGAEVEAREEEHAAWLHEEQQKRKEALPENKK